MAFVVVQRSLLLRHRIGQSCHHQDHDRPAKPSLPTPQASGGLPQKLHIGEPQRRKGRETAPLAPPIERQKYKDPGIGEMDHASLLVKSMSFLTASSWV